METKLSDQKILMEITLSDLKLLEESLLSIHIRLRTLTQEISKITMDLLMAKDITTRAIYDEPGTIKNES
jgi:hypothetical protein